MLNVVFAFFPRLKLVWFFLLPWAGYATALHVAPSAAPLESSVLLGWCSLLVYQFIKLGIVRLDTDRARTAPGWSAAFEMLPSLLPAGLVGLNQYRQDGGWQSYFLEQFAMEVTALLLAVTAVLTFVKNDKGRTAWQELAMVPLLFVGLVLAGISGIVHTWWHQGGYAEAEPASVVLLALALSAELRQHFRMMKQVVQREVLLKDFVEESKATPVIIGQIVLWLALPAIRYL